MLDIEDLPHNDEDDIEEEIGDNFSETLTDKPNPEDSFINWIVDKISNIFVIPVSFSITSFAHQRHYLPTTEWKVFLVFLGIFVVSFLLIRGFLLANRYLVIMLTTIAICWLGINSFRGKGYNFKDLKEDYVALVYHVVGKKPPTHQ
jgi:hypothetical protein